jgi:hypothetical protein
MATVRPSSLKLLLTDGRILADWRAEINLNGGVVSNKGFIRQMASPGTAIIAGKYISAWGGIQSAGQTVGQIVQNPSPPLLDLFALRVN